MIAIALAATGLHIEYTILNVETDDSSFYSAVTAFFIISLAVNALATALIVYKIFTIYKETQKLNIHISGSRNPDLSALVSILIESGLITFVGQLAQSIMYKSATSAFTLVGGSVVMLYVRASSRLLNWPSCFHLPYFITQGISMTAVFVRVLMGVSYDNNTARTTISTNLGRPSDSIQLTPLTFASSLNPSQTTKVRRSGSGAGE